jgi:hypothetical protein
MPGGCQVLTRNRLKEEPKAGASSALTLQGGVPPFTLGTSPLKVGGINK